MKSMIKKGIIYSLLGIMQLGIGTSAIEASPRHNKPCYEQKYENHHKNHYKTREQRIEEEKVRYEREIQRREYEEEKEWHERQEREKEHHKEVMRAIGGLALLYLITNN